MGDWYLINICDLLSLDDSFDLIKDSSGRLIPKYKCSVFENNDVIKKFGIKKILVKQIDFHGNYFREISTGIIIGSAISGEPLAVEESKKKLATNEKIIEYLNYMQEVCCILVTKFDILHKFLSELYSLYKPHSEIIKKIMRNRSSKENDANIIEFPILNGIHITNGVYNEHDDIKAQLTLLKGKER